MLLRRSLALRRNAGHKTNSERVDVRAIILDQGTSASAGPTISPPASSAFRAFTTFSIAFGGAYGFISGSRSADYDPNAFAVGVSFLFALACVALAIFSMRLRWMPGRSARSFFTMNRSRTGTGS